MTRAVNKIAASMKTAKFKLNIQNGVPKGGIAGIVVTVPAICSCFFLFCYFFGCSMVRFESSVLYAHSLSTRRISNSLQMVFGFWTRSDAMSILLWEEPGHCLDGVMQLKWVIIPQPPPITTCLPRSSHHPIWLSSTQRWLRGCDSWALVASIAIAVVVAGHFLCTFDIYLMHHYATISGNKGTEHFRVEDTVRLRKISALAFVISVSFSFWNMIRKTLN